jgi:hypothetical protein
MQLKNNRKGRLDWPKCRRDYDIKTVEVYGL